MKDICVGVRIVVISALLLLVTVLCVGQVSAQEDGKSYIVKFKQNDGVRLFSEDLEKLPYTNNFYLADEVTAEMLKTSGLAEYVAEDYDVELFDAPNDTHYDKQWSLTEWGYEDVYERGLTGKGVRIGIIDLGVYAEHPDLDGSISEESFNILSQNNEVEDEYGHGTFVSGIIGAVTDNGTGVAGIAPDAEIIMIKCFDGKTTKVSYVISALSYAASLDLDILNLSFGVSFSAESANMKLMEDAVNEVYDSGAIIVAAVGNAANTTMYYPAAFDNVIGVGAVDENLNYSVSSQYNSSVFVTAPGDNIYGLCSPDLEDGEYYKQMTGTSFASPYVTANIALLMERMPNISFDDLCMYLKLSSKDNGDEGYDNYYGWGVLNPKVLIDSISGGTKVYAALTAMNYNADNAELKLNYNTLNKSNNNIVFIYAFYEDGVLGQSCETAFADEVVLRDVTLADNTEVKCFVWNSLSQMQPFYKAMTVR